MTTSPSPPTFASGAISAVTCTTWMLSGSLSTGTSLPSPLPSLFTTAPLEAAAASVGHRVQKGGSSPTVGHRILEAVVEAREQAKLENQLEALKRRLEEVSKRRREGRAGQWCSVGDLVVCHSAYTQGHPTSSRRFFLG